MLKCLLVVAVVLGMSFAAVDRAEENRTLLFLNNYNTVVTKENYKSYVASWNHATNLTEYNKNIKTKVNVQYSLFMQKARENASIFDVTKLSEDTKRQINMIKSSSTPKSKADVTKLNDMESDMESIYSGGTVIDYNGQKLQLDPELTNIMRTSRNYSRLLFAWKGWRDATGPKIRPIYQKFVELSNKGAKENGWADKGEFWRSWYEVENFESVVEALYADLKPLYEELHAYVRYKLASKYPGKVGKDEPIPAHLFGNMWAQSWMNIYDLVEPYKGQPSLDVTQNLVKQNYTALRMVELAESFFISIGLKKLPKSFYAKSMIEKPTDGRKVICHASAWDFSINLDVRVKQCTTVTHNYLVTTHHELGHIQYYLQYWDQAFEYRTGANPGFHEAVGDTLSLSVDTPQHLKMIGLLDTLGTSKESDINALMKMALRKIAFLPFGFLIDQWRWNVFRGKITPDNYNREWWKLRTKYQGIRPPVKRTEKDFDPGAKYHIPGNTPYIRYFVSFVLQFQFHKAACAAAGFKGPLHQCSIYNSTAAGKKLGDMLAMGKSKPWPDALEKLTGTRKMDVGPLKEYFQPLKKWLEEERTQLKYPIGWSSEDPSSSSSEAPSGGSGPSGGDEGPSSTSSMSFASMLMTVIVSVISVLFSLH